MGKHGGMYTPRTTVSYENAIALSARAAGWKFGTARLAVTIRFYCTKSEGRMPDLDNLIKAILDGLQRGNAFKNDRQVNEIHAWRHYDENPRVEIEVRAY